MIGSTHCATVTCWLYRMNNYQQAYLQSYLLLSYLTHILAIYQKHSAFSDRYQCFLLLSFILVLVKRLLNYAPHGNLRSTVFPDYLIDPCDWGGWPLRHNKSDSTTFNTVPYHVYWCILLTELPWLTGNQKSTGLSTRRCTHLLFNRITCNVAYMQPILN